MQKLLNRLGHLCSMMDTPLLIIYDKIGINSWARYGIDGRHRTDSSCVIYFVPIRKSVHIARKASLLKRDTSAFKSQSHQIALSTSESSPNCMESILVLDASQNFKICISFPSLDIKSFFVLNLLYRPFYVNLLLFVFIEEASNPATTPLLGHRCRSSQEITGSPTPFSTSNHYLWICPRASFSLSNPNIAA